MQNHLLPTAEMLASNCCRPKQVGDIVQLGENAGAEFEIVHIEGQTAWIRQPVTFRDECLVPLSRLRFIRRTGADIELAGHLGLTLRADTHPSFFPDSSDGVVGD